MIDEEPSSCLRKLSEAARCSPQDREEFRAVLDEFMRASPEGVWIVIALNHEQFDFADFGELPYEYLDPLVALLATPFGQMQVIRFFRVMFKLVKLPTMHYIDFFARDEAVAALLSRAPWCDLAIGILAIVAHRQPLSHPILHAHGFTLVMSPEEHRQHLVPNRHMANLMGCLTKYGLELDDPLWEIWCSHFETEERAIDFIFRWGLWAIKGKDFDERTAGQIRIIQWSLARMGTFEPLVGSGFFEWSIEQLGQISSYAADILRVLTLELDMGPIFAVPPLIEAIVRIAVSEAQFAARCLAFQFVLRVWMCSEGDPSISELIASDQFSSLIPLFAPCVPRNYRVVLLHMLLWWKERIAGLEFSDELLATVVEFLEEGDEEVQELASSLLE
jgi:hypothetical protein